jgi:hypothetical protein
MDTTTHIETFEELYMSDPFVGKKSIKEAKV